MRAPEFGTDADDELPASSAETHYERSQPPSLRPSLLLGGAAAAARSRASRIQFEAVSHEAAVAQAGEAAEAATRCMGAAELEYAAAALELQRAQAAAASKLLELERAKSAKYAADEMMTAACSARDAARAAAMEAEREAEREDATAEAHFEEVVSRVLDSILEVAVEEAALAKQEEQLRGRYHEEAMVPMVLP